MLHIALMLVSLAGQGTEAKVGGVDVVEWLPTSPGPWPVVVFSHGFHGCARQSTFLTQALADAGYAVIAPNHRDAACKDLQKWRERPDVDFKTATDWTDKSYVDRKDDVENVINAVVADARFDKDEIALMGHSLGGYTALGVAGAWPSWKDARVKAVIALSPYATPFIQQLSLANIAVPVMYQGGTRDLGITPFVKRPGGAYDITHAPKMFMELEDAGHFAWTDLRATWHPTIIEYTKAFLDHELKGTPLPDALKKPHGDVDAVRIER
jgi:predicted dienelactone hydrolase